jgi:hypothetical protein
VPLNSFALVVLARAGMPSHSQVLFWSWVVVIIIGGILMHLFRRRVGEIDPKTGKPGGSETEAYAAGWFLVALAAALYITYSDSGVAVG